MAKVVKSTNKPIYECKVCLEQVTPTTRGVIKPCKCDTYSHKKCVEKWIKTQRDSHRNHSQCEVCSTRYRYRAAKKLSTKRCLIIGLWVLIVLAYIVEAAIIVFMAHANSIFDLTNAPSGLGGLGFFFGVVFGTVFLLLLYNFLVARLSGCWDNNFTYEYMVKYTKTAYFVNLTSAVSCVVCHLIGSLVRGLFDPEIGIVIRPTTVTFLIGLVSIAIVGGAIWLIVWGVKSLISWLYVDAQELDSYA